MDGVCLPRAAGRSAGKAPARSKGAANSQAGVEPGNTGLQSSGHQAHPHAAPLVHIYQKELFIISMTATPRETSQGLPPNAWGRTTQVGTVPTLQLQAPPRADTG